MILVALIAAAGWGWINYGDQLRARLGMGGGAATNESTTTNLAAPAPTPAGPQQLPPMVDQGSGAGGQPPSDAKADNALQAAVPPPVGAGKPGAPPPGEAAPPMPAQAGQGTPAPAQTAQRPSRPRTERPRGPRVRYINSEVMRQFCDGAGKGTPQCRTFRANTRRR